GYVSTASFFVRVLCSVSFFFSSRRRHTRCYRDWSSDVCSSDLPRYPARGAARVPPQPHPRRRGRRADCDGCARGAARVGRAGPRSEERRVGKECRSRWWREEEKKKEEKRGVVRGGGGGGG